MKVSYLTLGTNNIEKAICFYEQLFEGTGISKWLPDGRVVVFKGNGIMFGLAKPYNEQLATAGNGTMIGFEVNSVEEITTYYQKAIKLGGRCEGEPAPRSKGPAAYVRDLDGNKLCFFCLDESM